MRLDMNSNLFRKAILLIAPIGLLSTSSLYAQWAPGYDRYDDGQVLHRHQHNEKHALKDHQREERYYYGSSRALREHQKEERRQLRGHQRYERGYDDRDYRYFDRGYEYDRYYRRHY